MCCGVLHVFCSGWFVGLGHNFTEVFEFPRPEGIEGVFCERPGTATERNTIVYGCTPSREFDEGGFTFCSERLEASPKQILRLVQSVLPAGRVAAVLVDEGA